MKKLLYAATALAVLAGCSKDLNESPANVSATKGNMTIELNLLVAPESRAVFDGDSHIIFEADDHIQALIGIDPTDNWGIGNGTLNYNGNNEQPSFSGSLTGIETKPESDQEFTVYGICPASCSPSTALRLDLRTVTLLSAQTPTQDHWDGKADAMIIEPQAITGKIESYIDTSFGTSTYYKLVSNPTEVKLAHLFGFGCITFENLPEEVLNEKVETFKITATGSNKLLAGDINVDLRKNLFEDDFKYSKSYETSDAISLNCDGTIALKDYKAWFVANPGEYDVEISITTSDYKLVFKREGLNVKRSNITRPVIHFNEATDECKSSAVDLNGKTWAHDANAAYKVNYSATAFISESNNPASWGTLADMPKVEYGITFSQDTDNTPGGGGMGKNIYVGSYIYPQYINAKELTSTDGNVALTSKSLYAGIKYIKITSGMYAYGDAGTCNVSAFVIDKAGEKHQLGQAQQITAFLTNGAATLYDFEFKADSAMTGYVEIVWDNFSGGQALLSMLTINPAPEIKIADELVNINGNGGEGTIDAVISGADAVTVESDAEWLKVSYSDGKITYTAEAYDGDEVSRDANITVTAVGAGTSTKTIKISQTSSKFVLAEFTLSINAEDMDAYLEVAKAEYEAATGKTVDKNTCITFDTTMKAVCTDGSGDTKDVEMHFDNIYYGPFTNSTTKKRFLKFDSPSGFYNLSSLNKITGFIIGNTASSKWSNKIYLSDSVNDKTGSTLDTTKPSSNSSAPYMWTCTINQAESHGFLTVDTSSIQVYSFQITFSALK